jgi:hypothetical protein
MDSPLEEAGFEPPVPLRWCGGSRPLRLTFLAAPFRERDRGIARATKASNPGCSATLRAVQCRILKVAFRVQPQLGIPRRVRTPAG